MANAKAAGGVVKRSAWTVTAIGQHPDPATDPFDSLVKGYNAFDDVQDAVDFVDDTIGIATLQRVDESWPGVAEPTDVVDPHHFDGATAAATPAERAQRVADFVGGDRDRREGPAVVLVLGQPDGLGLGVVMIARACSLNGDRLEQLPAQLLASLGVIDSTRLSRRRVLLVTNGEHPEAEPLAPAAEP